MEVEDEDQPQRGPPGVPHRELLVKVGKSPPAKPKSRPEEDGEVFAGGAQLLIPSPPKVPPPLIPCPPKVPPPDWMMQPQGPQPRASALPVLCDGTEVDGEEEGGEEEEARGIRPWRRQQDQPDIPQIEKDQPDIPPWRRQQEPSASSASSRPRPGPGSKRCALVHDGQGNWSTESEGTSKAEPARAAPKQQQKASSVVGKVWAKHLKQRQQQH